MHFWVSATRGGFQGGFCWPRKIGTNWFMPAFVKRRLGESGRRDDGGTMVCCFSRKKSRNDCRICAEVMVISLIDLTMGKLPKLAQISKWKWTQALIILPRHQTMNPIKGEQLLTRVLNFFFVEFRFDRVLDFFVKRAIVLQCFFRSVASLRQLCALVIQPGTALFDNLFFQSQIEKCAGRGNALVVHDVELGFRERRRDFVFYDLDARAIACDHTVRLLDRADAANIDTDAGVKFQRLASRRRFRISKHDADFFADLVCKNATRA